MVLFIQSNVQVCSQEKCSIQANKQQQVWSPNNPMQQRW